VISTQFDVELIDQKDLVNPLPLANLMYQIYSKDIGLPTEGVEYFLRELSQNDEGIGIQFTFIRQNHSLIGYGRLEYRTEAHNDQTYASLEVGISSPYPRSIVFEVIIASILKNLPGAIQRIKISLLDTDQLVEYLQQKTDTEPIFTNYLNVCELEATIEQVDEEIRQVGQQVSSHLDHQIEIYINEQYPKTDPDLARLMGIIWNANIGINTKMEPEKFPVSRLLGRYNWIRDHNFDLIAVIARDALNNANIGFSEIFIHQKNTLVAKQSLTGVNPIYRGLGFGYLLKLRLLKYLKNQTEVHYWTTFNAAKNPAVQRINQKLGFHPYRKYKVFEYHIEQLRSYFNSQ